MQILMYEEFSLCIHENQKLSNLNTSPLKNVQLPKKKKKAFKPNKSSTEFPILLIANNPNFYEQIYES